jgi:hypothetical protein
MKAMIPRGSPKYEVWNHLEGGLQQAREELHALDPREEILVEIIGDFLFSARSQLTLPSSKAATVKGLVPVLDHPWVKFAADLRLAEDVLQRGTAGFRRFSSLVSVLVAEPLPPSSLPYLREASQTFVYGFFASSIVFCAASLERVLERLLAGEGVATDKPGAGHLLKAVRDRRLLPESSKGAERLVAVRNRIVHDRIPGDEQLLDSALGAIQALTAVLRECQNRD